jgi:DNA mismatch repair protein MSH2
MLILAESDYHLAFRSAASLIQYLELLADDTNLGAYRLVAYSLENYMKLDGSAVKALNLIPGPKEGNKTTNLFGLLNKCRTAQGSRLLNQWIKQPLMNLEEIGTLITNQ